jgi:hypothetical protein
MQDYDDDGRDGRLFAPATTRNRQPLLEVLAARLTGPARLLEVASGTGEHAVWLAGRLPQVAWLPSDPEPRHRRSIAAWIRHTGVANVAPPRALDVCESDWPLAPEELPLQAMLAVNLLHIAPWAVCPGLMAGAARYLQAGGLLMIYGPFMRGGRHTAESNARFDASLRMQDPAWGVRALEEVEAAASAAGLTLDEAIAMPANNLTLVFRK